MQIKLKRRNNCPPDEGGLSCPWYLTLIRLAVVILFLLVMVSPLRGCMIDESNIIGAQAAVNSACKDAGLDSASLSSVQAELTKLDNEPCYLISFTAKGTEYRYVINASDGKIIAADP